MKRFKERVNTPTISDWLLIRIAAEIRRVPYLIWGQDANAVNINDFKLKFEAPDVEPKPKTEKSDEEIKKQIELSKQVWQARIKNAQQRQAANKRPSKRPTKATTDKLEEGRNRRNRRGR